MRYTGPRCRQCRREGEKLFLKGERCESQKCSFLKRAYAPGLHGQGFNKKTEYAKQLREKQKAKRIFGVSEKQFSNYNKKANAQKELTTGDALMRNLELRIDNVIYRAGFAFSRVQARQFVNHGLVTLNGKKIKTPSIQVKVGDKFAIKDTFQKNLIFVELKKSKIKVPTWLKISLPVLSGEVMEMPEQKDFEQNINVQPIIEFYSR